MPALRTSPIYTDNPGSLPAAYVIPGTLELVIQSIVARFDGAGAADVFLPTCSILTQDGRLVSRVRTDQLFAVGDTGVVTFGPFLRRALAAAAGTIALDVFAEAAGFLEITSTDFTNPTPIVSAPSITADGATPYRIDFSVAAVDIAVTATGTGTSLNIQLLRGSTILGIIANYNVRPLNGVYGSIPIGVSVFDTPPAGSHVYSVAGVKGFSGGATATMRVFGSNAGAPFDTVTHPGFIGVSAVRTA